MRYWIFIVCFLTTACGLSTNDEDNKLDLSEAYGCYIAAGVPMIKIGRSGMEIPELDYAYRKTELVTRMNGQLWIHTIPAYGIVKKPDGRHVFDHIYKDKEINELGFYTRYWREGEVKYLENYSYPEGPLFLYKSVNCEAVS